jgi:AcrR family transcriptional regulator
VRYHRSDVVDRALGVLDAYGLGDLTMRRLGAELGVQPSALYHHFATKQLLLAAVADEILERSAGAAGAAGVAAPDGDRPAAWELRVERICSRLRDAMLAYRDGAELVATAWAFGLGAAAPYDELVDALAGAGLDAALVPTAARTLLHFVFGHAADEQTHLQAGSAGAIDDDPRPASDFAAGLGLVLAGIRVTAGAGAA